MRPKEPRDFDDEELLEIFELWCKKDASEWTGRHQEVEFYNKYGRIFEGKIENVKKEILRRWKHYSEQGSFWMNAYYDQYAKKVN